MVRGVVVDHQDVVQARDAVCFAFDVKGLYVEQRLVDGDHDDVAQDNFGATLAEERDLFGDGAVGRDRRGDEVGPVDGLACWDREDRELSVVIGV